MRKEMKHWDYPKRKKCCYEQWPGLKQLVIKRGRKLSHKKINQILGVPPYFSDSDDAEKQDEEVEVMDISEPEVEIQAESDSEVHSESDLSDIDDTFTAGVLQDCLLEITTGPSVSGADTAQMASQSVVSVPSVQAQTIPPLQEPQPTDVESDGGRTPEFKPQSESAYDVESKPQAQELPIVTATPSPSRSNTSPAPISSTQPQSVLKKHPHHKRVRFSMEVQERYINPFSTMAQTEPYHGDAENGNGPVISPPQPHQMPEIKDNESVDVQINATEQSSQDPRPENTTLIPQHPARIKELQQKSKQIISPTKTFHSLVRRQSVKPNKNTPAVAPPAPIPAPVKNDTSAKIPIMTFRRNVVPTAQTSGVLTDGGNSSSSGTVTSTNNKTHSNRQIELLSTLLMANKSKLQNFVEDLLIEPSIPNSSSEIDTIPELRSLLILKSHTTQSLLKEPKEEWYRDRSGMSIDEVRWRNSQNSKQLASVLLKYLMEEE
ncbi:hypothetical protein WICPIJ_008095 [Wickerhamomyces pijperi]|uniref:Uncharacterized protein n=1 Tax=Wickerhamomyces pijperi TaxID=599730 RepID=A0A9P8TJD6_WICPI|nr:hypothetical protein WICPIJ_008095 [Wickerhamomyces pijperi]